MSSSDCWAFMQRLRPWRRRDNYSCTCGNSDPCKFWKLKSPTSGHIWGVCCKNQTCEAEYLARRFVNTSDNAKPSMVINGVQLFYNAPITQDLNSSFQVMLAREDVEQISDLKPGDLIGFCRWYWIWHFAVVVETNSDPISFKVFHWTNEGWRMQWTKSVLKEEDFHKCFVFRFSEDIIGKNPARLVLARAESRCDLERHDAGRPRLLQKDQYDEGYAFFDGNCEHWATYCVAGTGSCCQSGWLRDRVNESFAAIGPKAIKVVVRTVMVESIENIAHFSELFGFAAVVMIEIRSWYQCCSELKTEFDKDEISKSVYDEEMFKKSCETTFACFFGGGIGLVVGLVASPFAETVIIPFLVLVGKALGRLFADKISTNFQEVTSFWVSVCESFLEFSQGKVKPIVDYIRSFIPEFVKDLLIWIKRIFGKILNTVLWWMATFIDYLIDIIIEGKKTYDKLADEIQQNGWESAVSSYLNG